MRLRKIEKAVALGIVVAVLAGLFSSYSAFAAQCDDIRHSVLRLHILANSDSTADQALKLKVRDRILSESSSLFQTAADKTQAETDAKAQLSIIQKVAQDEVRREGYKYTVRAQLVNMYFTTRTYGSVTLPAGNYDAVRITIGAAKGHNWWCVLFPPLCLPAATGDKKLADVLSPGQLNIVQGYNQPTIKVKFKVVEWVEDIEQMFKK